MMPRATRWRWLVLGLGAILACALAARRSPAGPQDATPAPAKFRHHNHRSFRIPITIEAAIRPKLKEVQLYVSSDSGANWSLAGRTLPDNPAFTFSAERDGEYWFAVRSVNLQGKPYPPDDRDVEPMLKVAVDTSEPTVLLEAADPRQGSRASVRWEVRDEHIALDTMVLEYRAEGARDWARVPIQRRGRIGGETWDAGTANRIKVRLSVADKAGNIGSAEATLPEGIASNPGTGAVADASEFAAPPPITPITSARVPTSATNPDDDGFAQPGNAGAVATQDVGPTRAPASAGQQPLLVGSPRFPLKYEVEDPGPDGRPHVVELWVTRNGGRTWTKQTEDPDRISPYEVDLGEEGTFGLWLVVQGASGLGDPPPSPGDRPQAWVEVDATPPVVTLDAPRPGLGANAGKILITWRASDAHLAQKPILLSYRSADGADSQWQVIGRRMENTGRYVWNVPVNIPPRFHIRVDAFDSVGNRGFAETTDTGPVVLDRSRPKGRILGLDPSARLGGESRSRR